MVDISKQSRAKRIAIAIEKSGLSQRRIAETIGVTPQSITKWLKTGKINSENLLALAQITGADLAFLISGKKGRKVAEQPVPYATGGEELYRLIAKLDEKQRHRLTLCALALVESQEGGAELSIRLGDKKIP